MAASSINILMTSLYCLYLIVSGLSLPTMIEDENFEAQCSRKCNSSSEDSFSHPQYQCSCSKSCTVYDDCCHDSSFKNTRKNLEHDFMCLSVVKRGEFKAVISCLPYKSSKDCRDSLGQLPPVTSRTTNITYGNVLCASCNEDGDNIITWDVQLRCDPEDENEYEMTSVVYDSDGFWKLNEVDGTRKPCHYHDHEYFGMILDILELRPCSNQQMISSCSPSWTDFSLIEKCRSYEDPVYFHNTAYRNVHCAECNFLSPEYFDCFPFYVRNMLQMEVIDPRVFDYCKRRDCLRKGPAGRNFLEDDLGRTYGGPGVSMSDMFNFFDMFEFRECALGYGKKCCPNQKFHLKTGKCRKVRRG